MSTSPELEPARSSEIWPLLLIVGALVIIVVAVAAGTFVMFKLAEPDTRQPSYELRKQELLSPRQQALEERAKTSRPSSKP